MKVAGIIIGCLILIIGLDFAGKALGLWEYSFFGTKQANIERQIFKGSQSYVDGSINKLSDLKMQYDTSKDPQNKAIIANTVKDQYSNFNAENLNDRPLLKAWLVQIRGGD